MRWKSPFCLLAVISVSLGACSPGPSPAEEPAASEPSLAEAPSVPDETAQTLTPVDPAIVAETISWIDLIPDEDLDILEAMRDGSADPSLVAQFSGQSPIAEQMGTFNAVESLDQSVIRMPGYILPLDYQTQGEAREFLLLPYHGACVHYPPPPPNQIVYLRSEEPVEYSSLWEPIWVEGRIEIERVDTDLAAMTYAMTVRSIVPYEP